MRIKLGKSQTLSHIAESTKGSLNSPDSLITHITTDTREALQGDLFVAIGRGKEYLWEAKKLGAFSISTEPDSNIQVENDTDVLLKIAKDYLKNLPYILYKIGITGSAGKTTTKEFVRVLLSERFKVHANEGNYNNNIGLPLSILAAPESTQILIMEMGMNHVGEIKTLSDCLEPDIGIITNVGTSHIGNLGSRAAIAKAKLEILSGMKEGQIFVPFDEPLLMRGQGEIRVSAESLDGDYTILNQDGYVSLIHEGYEIYRAPFALEASHHLKSLAFAASVGAYLGLSAEELEDGTSKISADNTRQRMIRKGGYSFWTDFYNSSYESVMALIETSNLKTNPGKKSIVIGDILELGDHSESIHYAVGEALGSENFAHIFLFGNYVKYILKGIESTLFPRDRIHINSDLQNPEITANQIKQFCMDDEVIYMKASRDVRLERILNYFDQRKL